MAPRGTPQIEVTFDIDANGILNVSAKDKATGKEQSIVIRASSGLSDGEIDRMVKDAEAHADEDKRFHEMVDARNKADNLIHGAKKSLADLGEQVDAAEKKDIEEAIDALQESVKGDDKADIEAKSEVLAQKAGALAERVYKQQAEAASAGGDAGGPAEGEGSAETKGQAGAGDDVVDAEFEEVHDDRKS